MEQCIYLQFSHCFDDVNILTSLHIQLRYLEIGNSNRAGFNYVHTIETSSQMHKVYRRIARSKIYSLRWRVKVSPKYTLLPRICASQLSL